MENLYRKVNANEESPKVSGWYDTDVGSRYWCTYLLWIELNITYTPNYWYDKVPVKIDLVEPSQEEDDITIPRTSIPYSESKLETKQELLKEILTLITKGIGGLAEYGDGYGIDRDWQKELI